MHTCMRPKQSGLKQALLLTAAAPRPQITHRISWEPPVLPERVELDDEGGYILTEAGGWRGGCMGG